MHERSTGHVDGHEADHRQMPIWFDHISDAIIVVDAEWRVTEWNHAAEQLYGWSRAEALGRPSASLIRTARYHDGSAAEQVTAALAQGGSWRGSLTQLTSDGREVIVESTLHAVDGAGGAPRGYVAIIRDMTAQYRAAADRARLAAIVSSSSDAIVAKDLAGVVTDWNDGAERMYGYGAAEMIGQPMTKIIPPERAGEEEETLRRIAAGERIPPFETVRRRRDGTLIDVSVTISPLRDEAGRVVGVSKVARDITAAKEAERALRLSEERYRTLAQSFPDGAVLLFDRELRFTLAAGQGLSMGQTGPQRIVGRTLREVLPPPVANKLEPLYRAALDGATVSDELTLDPFVWLVHALPIRDEAGAVAGGMVMTHDITERKRSEAALRQSAERLEVLHAIDTAILQAHSVAATAGDVLGRLRQLVPGHRASLWRYGADLGEATLVAVSREAAEGPALGDVRRAAEAERSEPYRAGAPIVLDAPRPGDPLSDWAQSLGGQSGVLAPLIARGQLVGALVLLSPQLRAFPREAVAIVREVADQLAVALQTEQLIEQLQAERSQLASRVAERTADLSLANAELARAARLKDDFLASMSHELRTPLNAILGRTEILQEQIYGPLTAKQGDSLRIIEESGYHLLALITDILDLSKIEANMFDVTLGPVAVDSLCTASLRMVAESALRKQISVASSVDGAVRTVLGDERRLKQILVNLLTNAVKFTPAGGQVGLEVAGDPGRAAVTFTVWDTGIGIAREDMAQLFTPFTQIDSSLSRAYGGTGLGLALVLRLADAHGGSVALESEPGRGSRFSVALPWGEGAPPDRPGRGWRILIADDHRACAQRLEAQLRAAGHETLAARTGEEALAAAHDWRPDAVIMDVQMPGIGGLEATRRLRASPRLSGTPVIALTALDMPGGRERALEAGADDHMARPADLRALLARIGQLVGARVRLGA